MSIDDRFKGRPKPPEKDRFATLKAWVHWAMKNPLDDDQELMAKDVNDLFALLGTREADLEKIKASRDAEIAEYRAALEKLTKFCPATDKHGTEENCKVYGCKEGREALEKYREGK